MRDLLLIAGLYPIFLAAQVALDRATGWTIADAFGKPAPGQVPALDDQTD